MNLGMFWINHAREEYLKGWIDLAEFERQVENQMAITYEQVVWRNEEKAAERARMECGQ